MGYEWEVSKAEPGIYMLFEARVMAKNIDHVGRSIDLESSACSLVWSMTNKGVGAARDVEPSRI